MGLKTNRIIVIEGPEGGGKSMLSDFLSYQLDWPVVHTGGPVQSTEDFWERVSRLKLLSRQDVIYDRVPFVSEQIYSHVDGRGTLVSVFDLNRLLEKMSPIIIYCRLKSRAMMLDRMLEGKAHKPPDYVERVKEQYSQIVDRYDALMRDLPVPVIRYNYLMDDEEDLLDTIRFRLSSCVG